jgi:L-threonylcarbamoyladenylate synthase
VKTEIVTAIEVSPLRQARRSNRQSQKADPIARAVEFLQKGETIALPTETVYGLAADAFNPIAVAKIFEAKERPHFDPLIVHLPDGAWLNRVAQIRGEDRQLIENLVDRFWPGPFTIVLPKKSIIPEIVTGGLDTVAVRISAHPIFAEIIRAFGGPLAAPSANRFGRVSPTTAQHVLDELDGRIPLIVDAGPTIHGIESTIIAVRDGYIDILRRGPITAEQLRSMDFQPRSNRQDTDTTIVRAPGQLPTHYAPRTPLQLIENAKSFSPDKNQHVGLLAWNSVESEKGFLVVRSLSKQQDLREAAAKLFYYLRELDQSDLDLIVAERVPEVGLGAAIMDRLRRAARHPLDGQDTPE